jgi:ABC-type dipeptide/oligopeptide/nickel transport system permease subunit
MASPHDVERARREGTIFGIPMGDLGWFQSLLMGFATGFMAFFLATFLAIVVFGIYTVTTHRAVDFALTYKRVGLPVGLTVGIAALAFLGVQWIRRMTRKGGDI